MPETPSAPLDSGEFDRTDRKIMSILQADGRISNQDLADRVNLSPSPCLRRVRQLEAAGLIRGYRAVLDARALGIGLLAYVNVKLEKGSASVSGQSKAEAFAQAVESWPEVVDCYAMTGDLDYLLRVQVRDLDHFSGFMMDQLLATKGVLDVRSSFTLRTIKEGAALPV